MLPDAGEVHEPQVDGLDVVLATHCQDFLWSHRHILSNVSRMKNETIRPILAEDYLLTYAKKDPPKLVATS